jgi:hypothetical protein
MSRTFNAQTQRCGRGTRLAARPAADIAVCKITWMPLAQTHPPHQVRSSARLLPKTSSTSRFRRHQQICRNHAKRVAHTVSPAALCFRTLMTRFMKRRKRRTRRHPLLPHRPPWQPSLRSQIPYPWACGETLSHDSNQLRVTAVEW